MESIAKAIQLKAKLDALRPLKKEDEARIMQKFRLDWNYHSNHLEGNSLTYGETKALLLFGITAQGKPLKDHIEVTGHNEAISWVWDILKQNRPLTENFIRELHKLILKEPYEVDALTPDGKPTKKKVKIGEYKTTPNHVKTKTGEIFRFATPEETPAKMHDLMVWYRDKIEEKEVNPILLAAEFHYKFIRIHPFDDGNGRTARILMNFILMQFGYPPVVIKTEDKQNYIATLEQADAGIFEPFIDYITTNLCHSLELMLKGVKGESIEEPDDIDKEIKLLEKRFKGSKNSHEILKNNSSIAELFRNSIEKASNIFTLKNGMLKAFYKNHNSIILINRKAEFLSYDEAKTAFSRQFFKIDIIQMTSKFSSFKKIGYEDLSYKSEISFNFYKSYYTVRDSHNIYLIQKLYNQQLTESEITQLINSEIRKHKEFIEQKLEELDKRK